MLIFSKMGKIFLTVCLVFVFSISQARACNPTNPICLFKMILNASPGLPVIDFVSVPAIIPHVPAALVKEGQAKLKEIADDGLTKIRSQQLPSLAKIDVTLPSLEEATPAENEEYSSLEAFPNLQLDANDPLTIAKSVEAIFLRPGWQEAESRITAYDHTLMKYYAQKFGFVNTIEIMGQAEYLENKIEEYLAAAEDIQKQIEKADDTNKAQRANFAANLMEYQLMVLQNQLDVILLQADTANKLSEGYTLSKPIFGDM